MAGGTGVSVTDTAEKWRKSAGFFAKKRRPLQRACRVGGFSGPLCPRTEPPRLFREVFSCRRWRFLLRKARAGGKSRGNAGCPLCGATPLCSGQPGGQRRSKAVRTRFSGQRSRTGNGGKPGRPLVYGQSPPCRVSRFSGAQGGAMKREEARLAAGKGPGRPVFFAPMKEKERAGIRLSPLPLGRSRFAGLKWRGRGFCGTRRFPAGFSGPAG